MILLPPLAIDGVVIRQAKKIVGGYAVELADRHKGIVTGVALVLFPATNRIQRGVEFVRQILLRVLVVFADVLKPFSYHHLTPMISIVLFITRLYN